MAKIELQGLVKFQGFSALGANLMSENPRRTQFNESPNSLISLTWTILYDLETKLCVDVLLAKILILRLY
ncbi:9692_t:CDS:2 [Entrophospora sp. SA101]|nr:9692_t:CDS:2 [Entrophospora sp. SA101]